MAYEAMGSFKCEIAAAPSHRDVEKRLRLRDLFCCWFAHNASACAHTRGAAGMVPYAVVREAPFFRGVLCVRD